MSSKEYWQEYYQQHKEKLKTYARSYYQEHREEAIAKSVIKARKHRKEHREYYLKANRRVKEQVLTHYGGGKLACLHCGITDIRVLTIDHIYNNGYKERQTKWRGGVSLYYALRGGKFPEGYQTLCFNCQWIKELDNREQKRLRRLRDNVGQP